MTGRRQTQAKIRGLKGQVRYEGDLDEQQKAGFVFDQ